MYLDEICDFCITLPFVEETQPFGPDHIVYKIKGKMFLLVGIEESPLRMNVKCDPERAIQLREDYPYSVLPGWHMNKKHWNTVVIGEGLQRSLIEEMIKHSYELVAKK
jgi:predicted DNA-binding protein (MmcQ/YjbR family)